MSLVALAAATCFAVLDLTRSIAAQAWLFTPLEQGLAMLWPDASRFEGWLATVLPGNVRTLVLPLFGLPGWAVLGALALLLGIGGGRTNEEKKGLARQLP